MSSSRQRATIWRTRGQTIAANEELARQGEKTAMKMFPAPPQEAAATLLLTWSLPKSPRVEKKCPLGKKLQKAKTERFPFPLLPVSVLKTGTEFSLAAFYSFWHWHFWIFSGINLSFHEQEQSIAGQFKARSNSDSRGHRKSDSEIRFSTLQKKRSTIQRDLSDDPNTLENMASRKWSCPEKNLWCPVIQAITEYKMIKDGKHFFFHKLVLGLKHSCY